MSACTGLLSNRAWRVDQVSPCTGKDGFPYRFQALRNAMAGVRVQPLRAACLNTPTEQTLTFGYWRERQQSQHHGCHSNTAKASCYCHPWQESNASDSEWRGTPFSSFLVYPAACPRLPVCKWPNHAENATTDRASPCEGDGCYRRT